MNTGMVAARRSDVLARTLAEVAVQLHTAPDREKTVKAIMTAAVDTIPGADLAGISLVCDDRVTADAPTDKRAQRLDELHVELGEGPCLSALHSEPVVTVDDLATDPRWPHFGARAVELGVRSCLSFQLFVRARRLGALNLYSLHENAFDDRSYVIGHLFAQHAAVAYAGASAQFHTHEALLHRDVIGQAKGILMHRDKVDAQQAFDMLVQASQHANMKLYAVAHWVTHHVPRH